MAGDIEFALRLTADGSAFINNVKLSRDEVTRLGEALADGAGSSDKFAGSMTESVAKGGLLKDAIEKAAHALVEFVVQAVEAGDKLESMSIGTGRSIAELQAFQSIADKNNGSLSSLLGTIDHVAMVMSRGGDETSKFARAVDFFGVSLTGANGQAKSAEQVTQELAQAYVDSEKTASTMAAAQIALGGNYQSTVPQILELKTKEEELSSQRAFGATVTDGLAAASSRYKGTMVDVHSVMSGFGNYLADLVLPIMQALADWFIRSATNGGVLQGVIGVLGGVLVVFADAVKVGLSVLISLDALVQIVGKSIGALIAAVSHPFSAKAIWDELKKDVSDINDVSNKALTDLWNGIDHVQKKADPIVDRGGFFAGKLKKEKDDTVDYTVEINKLADAVRHAEDAYFGIENSTTHYDAAVAKLTADLIAGKPVTNDQIDAYINAAVEADLAEAALRAYNKTVKDATDYAKAWLKDRKDWEDALQKRYDQTTKLITAQEDSNAKILAETAAIGLNVPQQIELNRQLEAEKIARMDIDPLQKQRLLDLNDERAKLLLNKEALTESNTAWKDLMIAMQSGVSSFIHDWVDGGLSSALKNLWGNFKKWALDAFAEIAAKAVVVNLVGSVTGAAAGGGGAGGDGSGLVNNLVQGAIGKVLTSGASALGLEVGGAFSAAAGAGVSAGMSTLGIAIEAGAEAVGGFAAVAGAAVAVIPVVGAVIAAAYLAYTFLAQKPGGPKDGGFATTGQTPGINGTDTSGTRWFTPNQEDPGLQKAVEGINTQYETILKALGGSGSATFAQGFSTDPQGKAASNVHTGTWVNGVQVFDNANGNVGRDPKDLQAELALQSQRAILAALQSSDLPEAVHAYLAGIDASTATLDQIKAVLEHAAELKALIDLVSALPTDLANNLVGAIGASDELDIKIAKFAVSFAAFSAAQGALQDQLDRDPGAEAIKAVAAAHATTFEKVGLARTALTDVLGAYDGSTEGTKKLTTATQAYIDAQVAALTQIENIREGLTGMFGDTQRVMDLAVMTTADKIHFFEKEATDTIELLKHTTDPAQIEKLSKIVNTDLTNAFNLMDPAEQKVQHDYLSGILTTAQTTANTQLDLAHDAVVQAGNDAGTILTQVQTALNDAAGKQNDAAQALIDAAVVIRDAAQVQKDAAAAALAASATNTTSAATNATAAQNNLTASTTPLTVQVAVSYNDGSGP